MARDKSHLCDLPLHSCLKINLCKSHKHTAITATPPGVTQRHAALLSGPLSLTRRALGLFDNGAAQSSEGQMKRKQHRAGGTFPLPSSPAVGRATYSNTLRHPLSKCRSEGGHKLWNETLKRGVMHSKSQYLTAE